MTYEEFKQAWSRALRESELPVIGMHGVQETLDLRSMDRTCESFVEPIGERDAEPFHVAASLSWRWRSMMAARTATNEEDMLRELLGREDVGRVKTKRAWLRVDVALRASLPWGKPIPMPAPPVWAKWARETIARMEEIEPVVPAERVRERRGGRLEIRAWQGEPVARVACGSDGSLKLEAVKLSSWQAIELPRKWDDSDRKPDRSPDRPIGSSRRCSPA